jgi:spermidine synthase
MKKLPVRKSELFLFLTGFFSILGQIVLLRELNIAFRGIELVYTLAFSAWLIGTALGVSIGNKNYIPPDKRIIVLFALISLLLPLDLFFIRNLHILFRGVAGAYLPFGKQIIAMFTALLPISIVAGILFQWVAKRFIAPGKTLASAYAIESLGGLTGGAASSLLIMAGFQNFEITLICSLICLATFVLNIQSVQLKYTLSVMLLIIIIGSLFYNNSFDNWMTSEGYDRKVESIDTPYNRVTIDSSHNQISFFEDNALTYETETFDAEEFVQLASLQSVNPEKILVLGGGYKGIVEQLITLPVSKLDYLEYNKRMFSFILNHLPEKFKNPLMSDKVNIIFEDPRLYLGKKNKYDIILSGMPEPASGQTSRFYTKEFFEEISACLNQKGIFAFKLPSSENFWTPALQKRNASVYKSLKSIFKDIVVLPGTSNVFIASNDLLIKDPIILSDRLISRKLHTKLVTPQYVNYLFTNDRFNEIAGLLNDTNAALNTDLKPTCYQYTLAIWLSKFFPGIEQWDFSKSKFTQSPLYKLLLGFLIFILILAGRKWKTFRRSFLVFIAGFQGMVLEIVLLLNYQMHNGILFQNIGILIMGFMLGLASGAWAVNRIKLKYAGIILIILSIIIYLLLGSLIISGNINTFTISLIALIISGFLTSGIFAFASGSNVDDQTKIISPLYSSDLLGGVAGSVLANFIFIPILGFGITAQFMVFPSLLLVFFL